MATITKDPVQWEQIPASITKNYESVVGLHLAVALCEQLKVKHQKAIDDSSYMSKRVCADHAQLVLIYEMISDFIEIALIEREYDEKLMRQWFNLCGQMPDEERYLFVHQLIQCSFEMYEHLSDHYQKGGNATLEGCHFHGQVMGNLESAQELAWKGLGICDGLDG